MRAEEPKRCWQCGPSAPSLTWRHTTIYIKLFWRTHIAWTNPLSIGDTQIWHVIGCSAISSYFAHTPRTEHVLSMFTARETNRKKRSKVKTKKRFQYWNAQSPPAIPIFMLAASTHSSLSNKCVRIHVFISRNFQQVATANQPPSNRDKKKKLQSYVSACIVNWNEKKTESERKKCGPKTTLMPL